MYFVIVVDMDDPIIFEQFPKHILSMVNGTHNTRNNPNGCNMERSNCWCDVKIDDASCGTND